jgi:hypothetical protein
VPSRPLLPQFRPGNREGMLAWVRQFGEQKPEGDVGRGLRCRGVQVAFAGKMTARPPGIPVAVRRNRSWEKYGSLLPLITRVRARTRRSSGSAFEGNRGGVGGQHIGGVACPQRIGQPGQRGGRVAQGPGCQRRGHQRRCAPRVSCLDLSRDLGQQLMAGR